MNIHKNARLTPRGRAEVVRQVLELGRSARRAGREARITEKTVRKWVSRARSGEPLTDRTSRPHRSPQATPPAIVLRIEVLRRNLSPAHRPAACTTRFVREASRTASHRSRHCGGRQDRAATRGADSTATGDAGLVELGAAHPDRARLGGARGELTRIIGGSTVGRRPTHRVGFRFGFRRQIGS
jgi:transposase-like protein